MSDAKPPPDAAPQDAAPADKSPSDGPPLDHAPPDDPSPDQPGPDRPPQEHPPSGEPASQKRASDEPPLDHVPPDEPPRDHAPPDSDNEPETRQDGIAEHLTSRDSWLRLLFMVLFVALWSITRLVVFAVIILQILFLLFSGKRNERLAGFGASLATYSYELVAYLTFANEKQPFPFSDWPDGSAAADKAEQADTE